MQCSIESDFEDENEICYTSKGRAAPPLVPVHPSYDEDSFPSSSWANTTEFDDDQGSSSMDYYGNDDEFADGLFQLPDSSTDLRVSARQALHLASIYEFLRHFSAILRLTPFLFEHFCTAMLDSSHLNNKLFSEIHLSLLRLFIKQDDDDGITYASETDIKGIVDLSFVTMDYFTWPYVLQLFVNSHPQLKFFSSTVKEYPFHVNLDEKINLLQSLCDVALTTKIIRREFDDSKPKQHDDNCRKCQKRGDLLCCDRCEATFHLTCLNPPLTCVPTVQWFCPVCRQNDVVGVTDCIPPREHRPYYLRHRCIGHDREQRRYWFICRRLFVEDEFGDDVRYYSTLEEFDQLVSSLDERGPERLLVYRLQKRYNDVARAMQLTIDLHARVKPIEDSLMLFTDGATPQQFLLDTIRQSEKNYQTIVELIEWPEKRSGGQIPGQLDGIYDDDDGPKSLLKKREFFLHSKLNTYGELLPIKQMRTGPSWEEHLRHQHRIVADVNVPISRLNENEIDPSIWRRYEHYQHLNRFPRPARGGGAYPRSNYYRDYYTGNNYEDEDGMMLDNEYDDFGEDFLEQEAECDTLFRKYDYRGTTRGRPRGRGRPPLYGRSNGRTSNSGHPPRGVNHLTTGSSYLTHQRLQNPSTTKTNDVQPKNKRKPAKVKAVAVPSASEERSKRPGRILRSGRISRKPRRDSETDFGSENSDDSGAKDKGSATENEDEEFRCVENKDREGSSSSTQSLTNFAAFAQNQLLNTGLIKPVDEDEGETDGSDLDDFDESTYQQAMVALLDSTHPQRAELHFERTTDPSLHYENFYQTNPLATRKQTLLHERDRRTHIARKFSINQSPSFAWICADQSMNGNYTSQQISDVLRLTLVQFESQIPLPFMHSHWRSFRLDWAKELLDLERDLSLREFIGHFLQFEASIKPVAFFDLFLDQVGYLKFRRETEKERDEAKKEEKDALIRRKIEADSIVQNVRFTRPLKHSVHRQRGEEYRLTGGQGWTFIRSTRRKIPLKTPKTKFDWNSLFERKTPKIKKKNPHNLPVPWTFTFSPSLPANIFVLPSYILRRLARNSMNLTDAPGFLNARLTGIGTRFGWPYPCGRPSMRTAWCYKVQTSSSFFAVAHHLKYLWFCLRWELLTEKIHLNDEPSINTHVDHDGICTRTQILAKRDSGPFESFCEYFVRKTISSQSQENNPFNTIPISKSRSRALPQPSSSRLIITEQWLPERQLQPNQIKFYYRALQEKALKRSNKEKKQAAKPFIVRISPMNNETTNRAFSVVKLADGQILLVPTISAENAADRRLRLLAPTPQILRAKTIRKVPPPSVPVKEEPSAEDVARTKVCENLLRSMVIKVERDLLNKSRTILNERVEDLRKEFLQQRSRRRSDQVRQRVKKIKGRTSNSESNLQ